MKTLSLRAIGWMTLAGLLMLAAGCSTVGEKTEETVDWVRGSLRVVLNEPSNEVNEGIVKACSRLNLKKISIEQDLVSGEFVYENAKEEKITITTKPIDLENTEIRIQVGAFGDQMQSEFLLEKIKDRI